MIKTLTKKMYKCSYNTNKFNVHNRNQCYKNYKNYC